MTTVALSNNLCKLEKSAVIIPAPYWSGMLIFYSFRVSNISKGFDGAVGVFAGATPFPAKAKGSEGFAFEVSQINEAYEEVRLYG